MSRLVLVGEAPGGRGKDARPALDPSGATGQWLMRMLKLSPVEYAARVERYNLFDAPDDGTTWSAGDAKYSAKRLAAERLDYDDRVVLLGSRVAAAFGHSRLPNYEWREQGDGYWVARVPHPSGRNRMWNDAAELERARAFFDDALAYIE